jgi:caffeoyl-CoA O-methyltransferase
MAFTQVQSRSVFEKAKRVAKRLIEAVTGEISLGKNFGLENRIYDYIESVSIREPDVLKQLREETAAMPMGAMQVTPIQGQFLALMAQVVQAKKVLEIGVFTGYSSLSVALALPEDSKIVACDVNEDFTQMAQRYWQKAGVAHKIDFRLAPALDTIDELLQSGQAGTFDFIFIDADKENHPNYYEKAVELLRQGGLIVIDNAIWGGKVASAKYQDGETRAIRALNKRLYYDDRISLSFLPFADGVVLATKR